MKKHTHQPKNPNQTQESHGLTKLSEQELHDVVGGTGPLTSHQRIIPARITPSLSPDPQPW